MLVNNLLLLLQPVPIALPENNLMLNLKPVPIALLVKNRTTVPPLVPIALRVKLLRMEELHASIVRSEKRVPLEKTVKRSVLRVQLRPMVLPHVPIVLLVKSRLKVLPAPIVLRVKLLPLHLPNVKSVLSEKRVPLELTVLRRVLLGQLHPVVPSHVPFVLLVKSRLQRQQMVVPNAKRVKLRLLHLRHVSTAMRVKLLLPVTPLVPIVLRAKLLKLHLPHVKIVPPEKLRLLVAFVVIVVLVRLKMEQVVASALQVKVLLLASTYVLIAMRVKLLLPVTPLVPIAVQVKLLPLHSRHVSTVLSEKRVPLELTVLRRVLLGKLHPMVPPFVPFVLLVKRRLQRQQMVVPIAMRVKLRMVLAVLVPIAKLGQFLLVVRLVTIAVQVKLLPHHSKTVSIVLSEKRV